MKEVFPPPRAMVHGAVRLLGDPAQDQLASERGEPFAAEIQDERTVPGRDALDETALIPGAAAAVREKHILPFFAVGDAEGVTRREAAEGLVLEEQAGLGGIGAVDADHFPHVPFAPEHVGITEIHVLADQALGPDAAGVLRQEPQRPGGGGIGKILPHGLEFIVADQQAVGGPERGLEFRRLQVLIPALVVAGPLREVMGQAGGALQAEPEQPAVAGKPVGAAHFHGEGEDAPGAIEREPFFAPGGPDGIARAPARTGIGLGDQRDGIVFR